MDHNVDPSEATTTANPTWQRPAVEVINLACELSAYAPDEGGPLF